MVKPQDESRADRFIRLASQRTNATIDKLRLLGNLSNKSNYEYSDNDIRKILSAIESQLKITRARFTGNKKSEFKL